jgi:hypothetical protein
MGRPWAFDNKPYWESIIIVLVFPAILLSANVTWVMPFLNQLDPTVGASRGCSLIGFFSTSPRSIWIDADYDGAFETKVTLAPSSRGFYSAMIGIDNYYQPDLVYNKPVVYVKTPEDVIVWFYWRSNDWGIYDDTAVFSSLPLAGRVFYIPPIKGKIYVAPVNASATVFYNGN